MKDIKKLLGNKIREIRKSKKLTQEKFAEKIKISVPCLSYIETGKFYPSPETLEKICATFDIEPHELYRFTSEKNDEQMLEEIFLGVRQNKRLIKRLYDFYCGIKWE